jgi:hypothetical protein
MKDDRRKVSDDELDRSTQRINSGREFPLQDAGVLRRVLRRLRGEHWTVPDKGNPKGNSKAPPQAALAIAGYDRP